MKGTDEFQLKGTQLVSIGQDHRITQFFIGYSVVYVCVCMHNICVCVCSILLLCIGIGLNATTEESKSVVFKVMLTVIWKKDQSAFIQLYLSRLSCNILFVPFLN